MNIRQELASQIGEFVISLLEAKSVVAAKDAEIARLKSMLSAEQLKAAPAPGYEGGDQEGVG